LNNDGRARRAEKPTSTNAEARRRQIVDEAARLFDSAGYHRVNMDDIAREVGIAKPTLYHYFRSKDEILYGIYNTFLDVLIDRHAARMQAGLDSRQLLLEVMTDILELMETHRGHVRALFEHHEELTPENWEIIRAKRDRYQGMVQSVIADGVASGELRNVDPPFATLAILGMCNWAYQWYRKDGPIRPREVAYTFWNMIVYGLHPETDGSADAPAKAGASKRRAKS